jgi:exodeoxyribonuclease V alpha subunit
MSGAARHDLALALRALPQDLVATLREADVAEETLHLADEAVSWVAALTPADRRAFGLVVVALQEARAGGSTRLDLDTLPTLLGRLGVAEIHRTEAARLSAAAAATAPLAPLFGVPGDYKPFILDGRFLYAHRDWLLEERLARSLAARLAASAADVAAEVVDEAIFRAAAPGRAWTSEQVAAFREALRQPLTVISGGPGTGKTALMVGIVRALGHLGLPPHEIAVAAPTGKAANRIAEALQAAGHDAADPAPQTLHRLLGFRGGRAGRALGGAGEFRHHENFPLPQRAVLVDEASMIDLALMERLTRAVRPDARLVLVGDANQLPSVEAGAVFRELGPLAFSLSGSHRQDPRVPAGAAVLAAASAVHAGDIAALQVPPKARPAELTFSGFEHLAPAGAAPAADRRLLAAFADHWIHSRVQALPGHADLVRRVYRTADRDGEPFDGTDRDALRTLIAHHGSFRVLTVTRGAGAPTGAEALNVALARRAAEGSAGQNTGDPGAGTPVLMIRNDYDRGLFNGDQGVLVRATIGDAPPRLTAVFPRGAGLVAFAYDGLRDDLRVAYATTVHKAQGAELDYVALVLPERDLPLLSRELVYTALTRARRSVVIVGRWELLALAVARPLERASGLGARLSLLGAM